MTLWRPKPQHRCKCGQFASARRWVGFRELLNVEPQCPVCLAFVRTTAALRGRFG